MNPLLKKIIANKKAELEFNKRLIPLQDIVKMALDAPAPRPFAKTILESKAKHKVIAEIKRISPGTGFCRVNFEPESIARSYESGGAAALSVLTDTVYFGGSVFCVTHAREATSLPVLRKDFIIDPYQIYEARAHGADAVLLMAINFESISQIEDMMTNAMEAGVEILLEIHTEDELKFVPSSGVSVGINNRDFRDEELKVDIETTRKLAPLVKNAKMLVSESGIKDSATMEELEKLGVDAFLIGAAFMRADDPGAALGNILA